MMFFFFSWLWHPFWLALCLCSHPSTRGADCMTQRSSCLSLQESQQLNTCGCDLIFIMIFILWRNVFSDSPEACQINVSACLSVYVPPLPRLWQTPGDVAALGGKVRNAKPQSLCHTLWSDQKWAKLKLAFPPTTWNRDPTCQERGKHFE